MSAAVKRCRSKVGVPVDRDAFIVEGERIEDGVGITITYRQVEGVARACDRVVFERHPADGYAALALAKDLAYLVNCESVFVIGSELPTQPQPKP